MWAELGEYEAELEKLQQAFHAAQAAGKIRLSEVIRARHERATNTQRLCMDLECLRDLQAHDPDDPPRPSKVVRLLGLKLEGLPQHRPSAKLGQYYARTRREAHPRTYQAGGSATGTIGTSAHAVLWIVCARAVVLCSGKGILATDDLSDHLSTLWKEWQATGEAGRQDRCARFLERLARLHAFRHGDVERWLADLRNESMDADDLLRQEQQAFELQPAHAGTASSDKREAPGAATKTRRRRKGTFNDRARDRLMTHVQEHGRLPTRTAISEMLGEPGRRQDLSDPNKCGSFCETYAYLEEKFGVDKEISPRDREILAGDWADELADPDGSDRLRAKRSKGQRHIGQRQKRESEEDERAVS